MRAKNKDDTPTLTPSRKNISRSAETAERTVSEGGSAACGVGSGLMCEGMKE